MQQIFSGNVQRQKFRTVIKAYTMQHMLSNKCNSNLKFLESVCFYNGAFRCRLSTDGQQKRFWVVTEFKQLRTELHAFQTSF